MSGITAIVPVPTPEQWYFVFVLVAMLGSALVAGVFFTFFSFVMKALIRLPSAQGIAAMQSINLTVLNPWFLGLFMGTAAVCLILIVWSLLQWDQKNSEFILLGSVFYIVGSLMVTGVFNVPRNEMLAKVDVLDTGAENLWNNYVSDWSAWNRVRTVASFLAAVCFGFVFY